MIEDDVRTYLCTVSGIIAQFAPIATISGIYIIQAPTGAKMPYVVIENTEGPREIIAANTTEETNFVRITVDSGSLQLYKGRDIAKAILVALENYRGKMGESTDLVCTCSSIRGWAGSGGAYRRQLTATIKHTMIRNKP